MAKASGATVMYDTAHAALKLLQTYGLEPLPENYEVAFAFCSGANATLKAAVDHLVASGDVTEAVWRKLYNEFFAAQKVSDQVLETGQAVATQLRGVTQHLQSAEKRQRAYGETLESAQARLSQADAESSRKVIGSILASTRQMEAHSRELERQLNASTQELMALRETLEQVRTDAMTDALTGVANRKRMDQELRAAIADADATGRPLSALLCDIDHFKRVNDTWGHQTGDQIIRFVASVLERTAKDGHLVARYGGEEFAWIMPNTSLADAVELAEQARRTIEVKKIVRRSTNEDLGAITVSFGVTQHVAGQTEETLLGRADGHLYDSKRTGRNRVTADKPSQRTAA